MMNKYVIVLVWFCFLQNMNGQQKTYPPRDESNNDPTLALFVKDMRKAVAARDQNWIINALSDDAESMLDSELSKEAFINNWGVQDDSSDFWLIVTRIMDMGGVFLHDTADHTGRFQFVYPYAYDINLNIEDDFYNMGLITGKNVNLRAKPNTKATVVSQLNYDMIRFVTSASDGMQVTSGSNGKGEPEWYKVETYGKDKTGWVNWRFVYNLMGPRLFFYKDEHERWKISALITGD